MVRVGQQHKGQVILLRKFQVGCSTVLADTDNHHILLRECVVMQSKGDSLSGAAGGVVLGIKVQHHFLALKIRQADRAAVFILQSKIEGFCSNF